MWVLTSRKTDSFYENVNNKKVNFFFTTLHLLNISPVAAVSPQDIILSNEIVSLCQRHLVNPKNLFFLLLKKVALTFPENVI